MDEATRRQVAQDCRDVIGRLVYCLDQRQEEAAIALFATDATWIRGGRPYQGHDQIRESFKGRANTALVRHVATTIHVEVEDADHAAAVTYYIAYKPLPGDETRDLPFPLGLPFSVGEWHDRLVRTPAGWRVQQRVLKRLFERQGG